MESLKDLNMEMFQSHLMMNAKLLEASHAEDGKTKPLYRLLKMYSIEGLQFPLYHCTEENLQVTMWTSRITN